MLSTSGWPRGGRILMITPMKRRSRTLAPKAVPGDQSWLSPRHEISGWATRSFLTPQCLVSPCRRVVGHSEVGFCSEADRIAENAWQLAKWNGEGAAVRRQVTCGRREHRPGRAKLPSTAPPRQPPATPGAARHRRQRVCTGFQGAFLPWESLLELVAGVAGAGCYFCVLEN